MTYAATPASLGMHASDPRHIHIRADICDLDAIYMRDGTLRAEQLGRRCTWLDVGTPASLLQVATFVQTVQERHGLGRVLKALHA